MVPDLAGLRSAYQEDAGFRALIESCARHRPRSVTRVATMARYGSGGESSNRANLLRNLARLAALGFGQVLEANTRARACMAWRVKLPSILHLATHPEARLTAADFLPGHPPELPALAPPPDGLRRLNVALLPEREAILTVPEDLSEEEARWLGEYLVRYARRGKSLPPGPQSAA